MSTSVRIERVSRDKLPAGSKVLTEDEVFQHYAELIYQWKPSSDVWPLKYGWAAFGAAACTTNFFILRHYRRRLKLSGSLMAVLTFGCAVVPAMVAPFGHMWYITKKIFVQDDCTACLHIKSLAIQMGTTFGYALTVNPLLCFMKAQHLGTYRVPGFATAEERLQSWQMYKKFTRRAGGLIYAHAMINSLVTSAITAQEIKYFIELQEKILQKNKEVVELKKTLSQSN